MCCNIPRVADIISCHSDACMVGVVLVRSYFKHHTGETYLLPAVLRNVIRFNDSKGVCDLNMLILRPIFAATNTLAKPPKFFRIGCVPHIFIFRVTANLSMFQWFTILVVQYWHCYVLYISWVTPYINEFSRILPLCC